MSIPATTHSNLPLGDDTPVTLEQIKNLDDRILEKIADYRRKKTLNKRFAVAMQSLSVIFSIGTTILIGWKVFDETHKPVVDYKYLNYALAASALASGITSLNKFFDYKDLWIIYNIAVISLKSVSEKLIFLYARGEGKTTKKELDEIFKKYETICEDMSRNYQQIRSSPD